MTKATQMWEDNPDTPLVGSNLSKTLDVQAESKFIYLTNDAVDMARWADFVINTTAWPDGALQYVNKIVYNTVQRTARRGVATVTTVNNITSTVYGWDTTIISPYNRLLKILARTKISLNYTDINRNQFKYICFDIGKDDQVFSYEEILIDSLDFIANTEYSIYFYYTKSQYDYATIKLVRNNQTDISWQSGGSDPSSPTGLKVISYRVIGGFKTDALKQIIVDSIWDLSTMKAEIVAQKVKIYRPGVGISQLQANDLPILDQQGLFPNENNVEGALANVKGLLENLRDDTYVDNRFGIRLLYSPVKMQNGVLTACLSSEVTLKVTAGYIDVFGTRVKLPSDIYFASSLTQLRVSDGTWMTGITLGQQSIDMKNKIFAYTSQSLIWRLYITDSGKLYVKNTGDPGGVPVWSAQFGGWYDTTTGGGRCIGKFQVSLSGGTYFIDKMSITDTYDEKLPTNSVLVFHGMFCPDGLIPCDGQWHDISGQDQNVYPAMPAYSLWTGEKWYEEVPDMRDRGPKGAPLSEIRNTYGSGFTPSTGRGGSIDCGAQTDSTISTHTHSLAHDHGTGDINIDSSGPHTSHAVTWTGTSSTDFPVIVNPSNSRSAGYDHTHNILISGGAHAHSKTDFLGRTERLTEDSAKTTEASSWSPYKEFLFCIKK